jgi:hypothetical protein
VSPLDTFIATAATHRLVGIDHHGDLCSCGDHRPDRRHHLAELVWAAFPEVATPEKLRSLRRRTNTARGPVPAAALAQARRVLEARQRAHEKLAARAAALGFASFADEADWLIAQDPWWHRRHGWPEHPFPNGYHPQPKELTA